MDRIAPSRRRVIIYHFSKEICTRGIFDIAILNVVLNNQATIIIQRNLWRIKHYRRLREKEAFSQNIVTVQKVVRQKLAKNHLIKCKASCTLIALVTRQWRSRRIL